MLIRLLSSLSFLQVIQSAAVITPKHNDVTQCRLHTEGNVSFSSTRSEYSMSSNDVLWDKTLLNMFTTPMFRKLFRIQRSVDNNTRPKKNSDEALSSTDAQFEHEHEHDGIVLFHLNWSHVNIPMTLTAVILLAGLAKLVFHTIPYVSNYAPESCLLIALGVVVGGICHAIARMTNTVHIQKIIQNFTPNIFFIYLLPPIILESAYSLHDAAFLDNLGSILLYAVVGTVFNIFTIGPSLFLAMTVGAMPQVDISLLECLTFSTLISAVDPVAVLAIFQELGVNKDLYYLVFGESLLNDAVTVVVYNTMVIFNNMREIPSGQYFLGIVSFFVVSVGGFIVGGLFGILSAIATKWTTHVRVVEPLAILGIAYLSYLFAELFHFSGIISIIACGLMQAHYSFANISAKSYTTVKYFTKMMSAISDTLIFVFLGIVMWTDKHGFNTAFVLWTLLFCIVFRFIGVFSLTLFTNKRRLRMISYEEQFIMAYGGLRGAVGFSLAVMLKESDFPNRNMLVTTTLIVVLFTVFIQGGTIRLLVRIFKVKLSTEKITLCEEMNNTLFHHLMTGIEELVGKHGNFYIKKKLQRIDSYLGGYLTRPSSSTNLLRIYEKIALSDHYANLYGPITCIEDNQPVPIGRISTSLDLKGMENGKLRTLSEETSSQREGARANMRLRQFTMSVDENTLQHMRKPSVASARKASVSEISSEDGARLALKKALMDNPFNKLHLKYNRNLINDENQELEAHLRRRHLNARRMSELVADPPKLLSAEDVTLRSKSAQDPYTSGINNMIRRASLKSRNSVRPWDLSSPTYPQSRRHSESSPVKSEGDSKHDKLEVFSPTFLHRISEERDFPSRRQSENIELQPRSLPIDHEQNVPTPIHGTQDNDTKKDPPCLNDKKY